MYTLVKYNYYFDIILVYKKILHTGGNCSIKRDARALLSLCSLFYVSCLREGYQIYIKPKTSDETTPPFLVCHWYIRQKGGSKKGFSASCCCCCCCCLYTTHFRLTRMFRVKFDIGILMRWLNRVM
jgi:hypothetical protein